MPSPNASQSVFCCILINMVVFDIDFLHMAQKYKRLNATANVGG